MKKLSSFILLIIGVWLLCEFVSYLGLTVMHGSTPRFEELAAARDAVLGVGEKRDEQKLFELPAVVHPYLGNVHNPDVLKAAATHAGFEVTEFGFFDDKRPLQRQREDRVVIGIFGGSVAWWFSSLGAAALTQELQKSPYFAKKQILLVRAALGAYKEPQQLTALSYLLTLGAQFDAVINLDGFNEVTLPHIHNVRKGIFPIFPAYWHDLLEPLANAGSQEWLGKLAYLQSVRKDVAAFANREYLRKSPTVNLVWELVERILGAKIARMKLERQKSAESGAEGEKLPYAIRGPKFPSESEHDISVDLARYWRRASILMNGLCAAKGIEYFHFLQPNQYVPGSKPMSEEEKKIALDPSSDWKRLVEIGYPLLEDEIPEIRKAGVRFFDLTNLFAKSSAVLYNDNCCHFNLAGNAELAQAIAKELIPVFERKAKKTPATREPLASEAAKKDPVKNVD